MKFLKIKFNKICPKKSNIYNYIIKVMYYRIKN